jgi:hypothetical protein
MVKMKMARTTMAKMAIITTTQMVMAARPTKLWIGLRMKMRVSIWIELELIP